MNKYKMLFGIIFVVAVIAADAEAGEKVSLNWPAGLKEDLRSTAVCDILNDAAFQELYATGVGMTPEMTKITNASDYYERRGIEIMQVAMGPDTHEATAYNMYRYAARPMWEEKMASGEMDFVIEIMEEYGCDMLLAGARKYHPLPKAE